MIYLGNVRIRSDSDMFRYSLSAKRRLFTFSEPVLLAVKMSDKDFAYKYV